MLYRKFYRYSDMETLKRLYVAFIHPNLEYATAVWDPHLSKDLQKLESVQHFACRVCTKRWNDAYSDMLHTLNIPPLSERRKLLKMCHLYKIVHGFINIPNAPLVYKPCTNHFTRYTYPLTLLQPQTRTNSCYFSFFSHVVAVWNTLTFSVVSSNNISMFRNSFVSP